MLRLASLSSGVILTSWLACAIDDRLPTTTNMLEGMAGSSGSQIAPYDPDGGSLPSDMDMLDMSEDPSMQGGSDASTPETPVPDDVQMDAGVFDDGPPDSGSVPVPEEPALCSGCVELVVPVTGPLQQAQFTFAFNPPVDFTRGQVTWRIQVDPEDANEDFFVQTYAISGVAAQAATGVFTNLLPLDTLQPGQWVDVTLDLAPYSPTDAGSVAVDTRRIERVGLLVGASASSSTAGDVRVYVDSVTFVGATGLMTVGFGSSAEGLILDPYMVPQGTTQPIHHP